MSELNHIEGIIWDLDGTLYRFTELFKTACNHAAARAATTVRPEIDYNYAFDQCVLSEQQYGFSLYWFHQETGMKYDDMHFVYHDSIDEKVIDANQEVADSLRGLATPFVLLTNSSRGWVGRILGRLGMDDIFTNDTILALEDFNFQPKGRSTAGYLKAIEKLSLPPEKILLVEDLPRNLVMAKEAGLQTALVHHGKIPESKGSADFLFHDALEVVAQLNLKKAA